VDLVRIDVSEELSASIIRVTRISELGTLAITSNRYTLLFLVFRIPEDGPSPEPSKFCVICGNVELTRHRCFTIMLLCGNRETAAVHTDTSFCSWC
jgi:hypothetical protein